IDCSCRALAAAGQSCAVGSGCQLAEGVQLEETAVGDRVRISRPVRLRRCIVLPGTTLDDSSDLEDMVITSEARFSARG
ncbi:MAG TPA: hypothetical protein PLO53_02555, partial [Candidatus Hydrogenedentes bacterium]|nr:hypothetical protein [Candidatus Hydrogenedentota bacterium]